jgi:hypothetical protein
MTGGKIECLLLRETIEPGVVLRRQVVVGKVVEGVAPYRPARRGELAIDQFVTPRFGEDCEVFGRTRRCGAGSRNRLRIAPFHFPSIGANRGSHPTRFDAGVHGMFFLTKVPSPDRLGLRAGDCKRVRRPRGCGWMWIAPGLAPDRAIVNLSDNDRLRSVCGQPMQLQITIRRVPDLQCKPCGLSTTKTVDGAGPCRTTR